MEAGLEAEWESGVAVRLAYTYMESEFEEYVKDCADLSGRDTPGLPGHNFFGELSWAHASGLFGAIDVVHVGELYADDANIVDVDAYTAVDLRAGYERVISGWTVQPFAGVNNLFDEEYNSNVRINARNGRFFEPAPDRNVYGGIRVAFNW